MVDKTTIICYTYLNINKEKRMIIHGVFEALLSLLVCFGLLLGVAHAFLSAFGGKKIVPAILKALQQGFGFAIAGFFGLVGTGVREIVLGLYYGISGRPRPRNPNPPRTGGTGSTP